MRRLLLRWRMHRLRNADYLFGLQLAAFDSGMNPDIEMLRSRYLDLVDAAVAVKKEAAR